MIAQWQGQQAQQGQHLQLLILIITSSSCSGALPPPPPRQLLAAEDATGSSLQHVRDAYIRSVGHGHQREQQPPTCSCLLPTVAAYHLLPPSPPQGDIVASSPSFSHMLPQYFKDPQAYQPDRFAAPREEDKAKPFTYLGFGGGRHGCLGQNFAYLQVRGCSSVLPIVYLALGCSWCSLGHMLLVLVLLPVLVSLGCMLYIQR